MKIGDKVRILIGIRTGQTGTIELINDMADYLIKVEDGDAWYDESELEPVIEHKYKVGDKVIDKNFPDTILIVCTVDGDIVEVEPEKYSLPKWTYNAKNLEPISDHMTADELAEEELDQIKAAEFERGYRYGINSVITNIQRFLKEITP